MQNSSRGTYYSERNMNGTDKNHRRMSTSGFEYPKDLFSVQYSNSFSSIPESNYQNCVPIDMFDAMNGNYEKKPTISNQSFSSMNNINILAQNQLNTMTSTTLDPRYNYNYSGSIPRFSSTPIIAQIPPDHPYNQANFSYSKAPPPMTYGQPVYTSTSNDSSNSYNNRQVISNAQTFPNLNSQSYYQFPLVVYDQPTNSYKNIIFYAPGMHTINSEQDINEETTQPFMGNDGHGEINHSSGTGDLPSEDLLDLTEDYLTCQLNLAQTNLQADVIPDYVKNDLLYYLPEELANDNEVNRTESQSMPSLHGDETAESEFDSSEEDQLNTVHADDMLQELQKMSMFTNVVNLPLPRHNDVGRSAEFPSHINLSRFKKTRIKERATVWHVERFLVRDNLVKIIPDNVAKIRPMDLERLNEMGADIFGGEMANLAESQPVASTAPACAHSSYRCKSTPIDVIYLNHSSRPNQKFLSSYTSYSPSDPNNCSSTQIPANISSRYLHRKSMQIPVRFPVVFNQIIPLLSPVVQNRNRMFFDVPNIPSSKNPRRRRRWSISDSKYDKIRSSNSPRTQNSRQLSESFAPNKCDITADYFKNRHSFDLQDLNDHAGDLTSQISLTLESKLDKQLAAMRKSILTCVENSVFDFNSEIQSLRNTQMILEKQLKFYMEKVKMLENSVRQNLPQEQWDLFGVADIHD